MRRKLILDDRSAENGIGWFEAGIDTTSKEDLRLLSLSLFHSTPPLSLSSLARRLIVVVAMPGASRRRKAANRYALLYDALTREMARGCRCIRESERGGEREEKQSLVKDPDEYIIS